ncbi:putative 2-aminoethylphosphonate ABC transporter permease subunit [soil metagenome]
MSAVATPTHSLIVEGRSIAAFGRERMVQALLIVGAVAALLLLIALPTGTLIMRSVFDGQDRFVGLDNFVRYVQSPVLLRSTLNSLVIAIVTTLVCVSLAFTFAYALTLSCMRGKTVFRAIALVPLLAPSLLPAISLIYLFGNQGWLKGLLLGQSVYGMLGMVIGGVFWTLPHALVILTTALATQDGRLYEAAETMGASRWRAFRTVTLPSSRYGLIIASVVVFILVLTDFGVPKVIGGQTPVLATDIYKQVVGQQNFQMGAVVGFMLLLPAVAAFFVERHVRARQSAVLSVRATPYDPRPHASRDWALFVFCALLAAALLVMIGMAIFASFATAWPYRLTPSFKNYDFDNMDGGGWGSYFNSLRLSFGVAVVGSLVAFVTAYLVEKPRQFRLMREALNLLATLPLAIPGLALGVGYIMFFNSASNPLHGIYGTMTILVLCTVAHYFSVPHITSLTGLRQLDIEFERVAESLGVPFWRNLISIHLPICLPVVLSVGGYFFVSAMTTVSAVVFLYSPQTTLASIAVLNMDDAGDVAPAAAMASLIFATTASMRVIIAGASWAALRKTRRWRTR